MENSMEGLAKTFAYTAICIQIHILILPSSPKIVDTFPLLLTFDWLLNVIQSHLSPWAGQWALSGKAHSSLTKTALGLEQSTLSKMLSQWPWPSYFTTVGLSFLLWKTSCLPYRVSTRLHMEGSSTSQTLLGGACHRGILIKCRFWVERS